MSFLGLRHGGYADFQRYFLVALFCAWQEVIVPPISSSLDAVFSTGSGVTTALVIRLEYLDNSNLRLGKVRALPLLEIPRRIRCQSRRLRDVGIETESMILFLQIVSITTLTVHEGEEVHPGCWEEAVRLWQRPGQDVFPSICCSPAVAR